MYWPFGRLNAIHLAKDVGGIPAALARQGRQVKLVTGVVDRDLPHQPYDIRGTGFTRRTSLPENARELLAVLPDLLRDSPETVLVVRSGPLEPILVLAARFVQLFRRRRHRRSRFLIKLDWDGSFPHERQWQFRLYLNLLALTFDAVTVESSCALETLEKSLAFRTRLRLVPNGFDAALAAGPIPAVTERRSVVVCVARITRMKRQELLLRAFAMACSESPQWRLELVGPIEEPAYAQRIRNTTRELGVAERVEIRDHVNATELRRILTSASVFALLSAREGFSVAKVEAMACGVPVLSSAAGCGRDLAAMGAKVVPVDDLERSADALRMIIRDQELRSAMAAQQRSKVLSWDEVTQRLLAD